MAKILKIAIVAPSGPPDPHLLQKGIEILDEKFGPLDFEDAPNVGLRAGYLAGEDEDRSAGMQWAFEESDAELVWFARGGFGTTRIVDSLPWKKWAATGKTLLGYSDATAFLIAYSSAGGRAIHAPMIAADIARGGSERSFQSLDRLVFRRVADDFLFEGKVLSSAGQTEVAGPILAGNLAVMASLAGTPAFPSVAGKILCLEEVNEEPYRIDRALTQLKKSGAFNGVVGVVFGSMTDCIAEHPERSFTVDQVLERFALWSGVPVIAGFPFGHGGTNSSLPLGAELRISWSGGFSARISPLVY